MATEQVKDKEKQMEAEKATEATVATNGTNVTATPNTPAAAETKEATKTIESIKIMKGIYLEKEIAKDNRKINSIAYFIERYKEDEFVEIDGTVNASAVNSIAKSSFAYSDVKKILFKGSFEEIGEKAFEDCEELVTVIFGETGKDGTIEKDDKSVADEEKATIKNLTLASLDGDYVIQANAFKGCGKLTTLVLPKVEGDHKFVIEKDAFCGCIALRTVVAICDKMDVTGNPFADSPERLTFVCKKNSEVARFARENGYRSVYVD